MKWQIADEYLEEFVAKIHRTMTPRTNKKFITHPMPNTTPTTTPDQNSPLRLRYPPSTTEGTPIRPLQIPTPSEYMMSSPTTPIHSASQIPAAPPPTAESATPERSVSNRQFMPMSSPAPFYRYSSITTPASAKHEHSSPPSSGAIDLAETLVEFSSPIKLREHHQHFARQLSLSSEQDESPSRGPLRNGIKSSSLGDLQGVDLLRGFEKISSWREGSTPVKDSELSENGFGRELKRLTREHVEGVNGNGVIVGEGCIDKNATSPEEMDSQMTDIKMESEVRIMS